MQFDAPANFGLGPDETVAVTMSTSCGDLGIRLDPSIAPETVNSFVFLASEGYFDGTAIPRVIPGFAAQGGDQTATGTGGPGYAIPDEVPPLRRLAPQYSIFGWVTEGLEILDLLQEVPLG
jgi:cyclophilin family peptidyl-prolyl cis-trans isomerase